jgi:hypothetical protein
MRAATALKLPPLSIAQVIWFGLGAGAYATSFFLPAVSTPDTVPLPGFFIAFMTVNPLLLAKPHGIFAMAGGLLNPVVLCYAAAWIARSRSAARPWLAAAVLIGVIASAAYIHMENLTTYYGFFAWSAGALVMVSAELAEAVSGRLTPQDRTIEG